MVAASAVAASGTAATATNGLVSALYGGLGSIIGALIAGVIAWTLARASRADEREKDAVRRAFDSAGSHMATVSFDKYVEFCEAYAKRYRTSLVEIFRRGPCREAMGYSSELAELRTEWVLWITSETDTALKKFEDAMFEMGSHAWQTDNQFAANVPNRGELIQRMYKRFCELGGLGEWGGEKLTNELAVASLMSAMRSTLGTEQFDKLRQETVKRALTDLVNTVI